ncbi:MAG TPA: M36 family metallopeptidase [Actinomycetota bacterium]|nr:M36 family metallopeptidase [Actinomycetota bacterium]
MRRALAVFAALAALAATVPSAAGAQGPVALGGSTAAESGTPGRAALVRAARVLQAEAPRLGVDASAFRFESVRRSIVGMHVRGREYRAGVPVATTSAAVHIVDGRVWQVEATPSELTGQPTVAPIPAAVAIARALAAADVDATTTDPRAQRLLVPVDDRLADVYRVAVTSLAEGVVATVDISAVDGSVVAVQDARVFAKGHANVFDPNPVVALRNNKLREPGVDQAGVDTDLDSEELTKALSRMPLLGYDETAIAAGRLIGPWVDVQGPGPLGALGETNFAFTRGDPRFETTMAYAHLDRLQRYFQELGFKGKAGVNAEPQKVYTLPLLGFDNSFYSLQGDFMVMGAGGIDDGEDAEVIVHEYGHAIHHAQVPGWGETDEGGAMGEGWGDFLAAAYFAATSSRGFQDTCIADWDAVSYSDKKPPCLRRADSKKRYPKDIEGQVHADGELWSAFLWKLRSYLGSSERQRTDNVLKLVLTSHEFLTPTAEFKHAVRALETAAKALDRPSWVPLIRRAASYNNLPS